MKLRILAAACLLLLLTACARPSLADQLDQIEAAAPTTAAPTTVADPGLDNEVSAKIWEF